MAIVPAETPYLTRFSAPGFAAYAAAKGAVEVLSLYLAKELGSRGVAVNTVAPGAIETDLLGGAVRDTPDVNREFAGLTALGRVGLPDDIGPMIASLLGEDIAGSMPSGSKFPGGRQFKRARGRK